MPEQPLVYVPYGKCGGLNPLTGIGRIVGEPKVRAGLEWVLVESVDGEDSIPLEKWVLFEEVQCVSETQIEKAIA